MWISVKETCLAHDQKMEVQVLCPHILIRVLEKVDRVFLRFTDENHERSSRFSDIRGYSLIGKTAILHIVISGSIPDISIHASGLYLHVCELEKLNG